MTKEPLEGSLARIPGKGTLQRIFDAHKLLRVVDDGGIGMKGAEMLPVDLEYSKGNLFELFSVRIVKNAHRIQEIEMGHRPEEHTFIRQYESE